MIDERYHYCLIALSFGHHFVETIVNLIGDASSIFKSYDYFVLDRSRYGKSLSRYCNIVGGVALRVSEAACSPGR